MTKPRRKADRKPVKRVKSSPARADNPSDAVLGTVGLDELRRLIRLVRRTGIGELEVKSGQRTVRISAQPGVSLSPTVAAWTQAAPVRDEGLTAGSKAAAPNPKTDDRVAIAAPMVGTLYRAPAPDADPYVEVGDRVEVGQTVCIIEAMKLMNEIESEVRGRVVEVLVENGKPVEFGQKLFLVEAT